VISPSPVVRLSPNEVLVEAGASTEAGIELTLPPLQTDEPLPISLSIAGLAGSWCTFSTPQFTPAGESSRRELLVLSPPEQTMPGVREFRLELRDADGLLASTTGRLHVVAPLVAASIEQEAVPRSCLVQFLPRNAAADPFLGRFLLIFEGLLNPIEKIVDNRPHYLDPAITPAGLLEWLASWLAVPLDDRIPDADRRALVEQAVELYRWKGTRRALKTELKLRTGQQALIVENFDGLRLGQDAAMGLNTQLGRHCEGTFVVTLPSRNGATGDDLPRFDELVDTIKPAGCGHVVRVVRPGE
jgi:phage tail-like protein